VSEIAAPLPAEPAAPSTDDAADESADA